MTFRKAEQLQLQGKPVKLSLVAIGGQKTIIESKVFLLKLYKSNGETVQVEAFGIQRISSEIQKVNQEMICKILGIPLDSLDRPLEGEVDVLIGQQAAFLHPVFQKVVENLVLMKNDFGAVVSGSHPKLISSDSYSRLPGNPRSSGYAYAKGH